MRFDAITLSAFAFGVATSTFQLLYLSKRIALFSDLSATNPTVYLISGTFGLWFVLTVAAIVRHRVGALWVLVTAPTALYGPLAFVALDMLCGVGTGRCQL